MGKTESKVSDDELDEFIRFVSMLPGNVKASAKLAFRIATELQALRAANSDGGVEPGWRPVVGFEGLYEVSIEGDFRSLRTGTVRAPNPKAKYHRVSLAKNGSTVNRGVHRLVAEAFIPNPDMKPEVNHKDGDGLNNTVENLEWVTRSENEVHSRNVLGNPCRPIRAIVLEDGREEIYRSVAEAEDAFGLDKSHIADVAKGRRAHTLGRTWQYIDYDRSDIDGSVEPLFWQRVSRSWQGTGIFQSKYVIQHRKSDGLFDALGVTFQTMEEAQVASQDHYKGVIFGSIKSHPPAKALDGITVTEEMVQRAAKGAYEELMSAAKEINVPFDYINTISVGNYRIMRAALEAALAVR